MKLVLAAVLYMSANCAWALEAAVPKSSMEFWNDDQRVSENNCYNYSTNRETDSFAQPGEASGKEYVELTCPEVYAAASQDLGLTPTSYFPFSGKNDDTLIALVVSPGYDFHWYRRDDNGKWSHKMGSTPAVDVDNSGLEIVDPEKADRGSYRDFCGYFRVKNYTSRPDEQNGGFVRIGNMAALPLDKTSQIVVSRYSGRRNPSFALREYMQNADVAAELRNLAARSHIAALVTPSEAREINKLDSRGIEIRDSEGLIFPKGTRVHIRGEKAFAYFAGSLSPVAIHLGTASVLERSALEGF